MTDRCPVHDTPETDKLHAWGRCPLETVSLEASEEEMDEEPTEEQTCPHFVAMLVEGLEEVRSGHYFQMNREIKPDGTRVYVSQEYRNHKPYGEPEVREWNLDDEDDEIE